MMKDYPEISVLMSVYNGGSFLAEAIESVLSQTFKNFEFIIVDDGSTDNSTEIATSFCDERILLIENLNNIGVAKSLNQGASLARGKYLARMDADDISLPGRFLKQKAYLDRYPSIGVLGTDAQFVNDQGQAISYSKNRPYSPGGIRWSFLFNNPMCHPSIMMRKECFLQAGGYLPEFQYSQDYNLWIRMMKLTDFANLPEVLLHYRIHDANISTQHKQGQLTNSIENSRVYLSEQIGKEITTRQASLLRRQSNPKNDDEVFDAIRIIRDLFYSAMDDDQFAEEDREIIRTDAWRRIYLFGKSMKKPANQLAAISTAYKVYPYLTSRRIFSAIFRTLKNRYSQTHLHRGIQ